MKIVTCDPEIELLRAISTRYLSYRARLALLLQNPTPQTHNSVQKPRFNRPDTIAAPSTTSSEESNTATTATIISAMPTTTSHSIHKIRRLYSDSLPPPSFSSPPTSTQLGVEESSIEHSVINKTGCRLPSEGAKVPNREVEEIGREYSAKAGAKRGPKREASLTGGVRALATRSELEDLPGCNCCLPRAFAIGDGPERYAPAVTIMPCAASKHSRKDRHLLTMTDARTELVIPEPRDIVTTVQHAPPVNECTDPSVETPKFRYGSVRDALETITFATLEILVIGQLILRDVIAESPRQPPTTRDREANILRSLSPFLLRP
jgi:hypothetical protein